MELIVRGLMALALIDCPEADEVCPNGAAILIPDTSYFEKLGLHQHSAVLSIPLAWIDADAAHGSGGGYEVVDSGSEPMAVFVLAPGDHLVLEKADELAVRPFRDKPVLKRTDAAELPLSQLLQAAELVERPEVDEASIRNMIWIRSGSISARSLFGAELEGKERVANLSFSARGAHNFQPRPLATEVVARLPDRGVVLERLSPNTEPMHWSLQSGFAEHQRKSRPAAVLSHLPIALPFSPAADQVGILPLLSPDFKLLSGQIDFPQPGNPVLQRLWTEGSLREGPWPLHPGRPGGQAWFPPRCPPIYTYVVDLQLLDLLDQTRQRLKGASNNDCCFGLVPNDAGNACVERGYKSAEILDGVQCPAGTNLWRPSKVQLPCRSSSLPQCRLRSKSGNGE